MTDPISGKVASQAIQQAQQMEGAGEASKAGSSSSSQGPSFQEVMNAQNNEAAQQAEGPQQIEKAEPVQGKEEARLENFVSGVLNDESKLDTMMSECMGGKDMSQQDLLKMQSLIYSYSQRVDLATKVVEKAAGGVKQMMNTQV